jgi:hypothetical protein
MLLQVLKKMVESIRDVVSKEASDIMSQSNEIDFLCEKGIRDIEDKLTKFSMSAHSKSSASTYEWLKSTIFECLNTIKRVRGINASIPNRVVDIEKEIKKLGRTEDEVL